MKVSAIMMGVVCAVRLYAGADSVHVSTVPHTVDVIEAAVRDLTDTLITRSAVSTGDPIPLFVHEHPDASWIRSIVARRMEERGVPIVMAETSPQADIEVTVMDVSTRYALTAHRDSLERQVVVKLGSSYRRKAVALDTRSDSRTISRPDARAKQSTQHVGAHAELPEAPSSIWEDALEPLIYIAAAVVTVVLFFTVRTQ